MDMALYKSFIIITTCILSQVQNGRYDSIRPFMIKTNIDDQTYQWLFEKVWEARLKDQF